MKVPGNKPLRLGAWIILCPIISCMILSCTTVKRSDGAKGILQGMLYDYENGPVSGYSIFLDGAQKTVTDINGRFCVPDTAFGFHAVSGNGYGYVPCHEQINFSDKTEILYIRLPSNSWLYADLDAQLQNANFDGAEKSLARFSAEEQKSRKHRVYSSILKFRTAPSEEKAKLQEKIQSLIGEVKP